MRFCVCYIVHMKQITIRELHKKTGEWVRRTGSEGGIIACCTYGRMELFAVLRRKLREAEITK